MGMLHLQVVAPTDSADAVRTALDDQVGAIAVTDATSADGHVLSAYIARESADAILDALRAIGVFETGMITLEPLDTTLGALARRAEEAAPGEAADAVIWDDLSARTGEDATLTGTFLAFMVLATVLAAIGVVTDSPITIVGAMVVGPEFGPLAAIAVGIVRVQYGIARRASIALLVGFPLAIAVTAVLALLAHAAGLIDRSNVTGQSETEFIYHPGWFSLITALVAGTAGTLSLTSSKSAALVGVFISVTTIPAAGNTSVACVLGLWHQAGESLLQLAINLFGIVVAAVLTLVTLNTAARRHPDGSGRARPLSRRGGLPPPRPSRSARSTRPHA